MVWGLFGWIMGGGPKWTEFGRFALSFVLRALSAYVDYFKMPTVDFKHIVIAFVYINPRRRNAFKAAPPRKKMYLKYTNAAQTPKPNLLLAPSYFSKGGVPETTFRTPQNLIYF